MDVTGTVEDATPSFFENPLGWLFNKASELGREKREEIHEWAEHKAGQNTAKFLHDNPELAAKAKSVADMGLEKGTMSPAVYEMLQQVETTQDHAPVPDASLSIGSPSVDSTIKR